MSKLRIFSYLPNPRIWKATIAGRLCGVEVEIRGASPEEIGNWLWDFDAKPIAEAPDLATGTERVGRIAFDGKRLYKTDAFLLANPFGTIPAAFSPDGSVGIFESNSIMRAVARLGTDRRQLYGADPYEASRIDSFLDASLVFGREAQIYLIGLRNTAELAATHSRMREAFTTYLLGIEQALRPERSFLVGSNLSLADICFVAEIGLLARERLSASKLAGAGLKPIFDASDQTYPRAIRHFWQLVDDPAFAPDVKPYIKKLELAA